MSSNLTTDHESWRAHLLQDPADLWSLLRQVRRVAVIGIKTEQAGGPAYGVPRFMQRVGYEIIPVPVYFPDTTEILGVPVHRSLETIEGPIDMVLLFRRSEDVAKHLDEMLAARPRAVWMQLGIRNDEVAEQLARAGIDVVQDRCVQIEWSAMAH